MVLPRLFGGEEMSSRTAPIAARTPPATLVLGAEDARRLGAEAGATLALATARGRLELPLRIEADFPAGLAGVPAGLDPGLVTGAWVRLAATTGRGEGTP